MPKMKTNKSAAKRFKVRKSGKIAMKLQGLRHILTGRTKKSKRQKRAAAFVDSADLGKVRDMLPYG